MVSGLPVTMMAPQAVMSPMRALGNPSVMVSKLPVTMGVTLPEKPRSPKQRYVLTEAGVKLKLLHDQAACPTEEDNGH